MILLIDTSSILYRSFYKLPEMKNTKNFPTGALFGFVNTFIKLLELKPKYIVACLDTSRGSLHRREIYPEYKAHRKEMPELLAKQMPLVEELINALGACALRQDGIEADDLIASLTHAYAGKEEVCILSSDKDLMQLVSYGAKIIGSRPIENREQVKEELGVFPEEITDFFALKGDASDGIPGVKGIGQKIAEKLINTYQTLDNIYSNLDALPTKLAEKLESEKEMAYISKALAELTIVEVKGIEPYSGFTDKLQPLLEQLEFKSIMKNLNLEEKRATLEYKDRDRVILESGSIYSREEKKSLFDKTSIYMNELMLVNNVEIGNGLINTYDAKTLFKKQNFNLDMDIKLAYHLLYPEEKVTLDRVISRFLSIAYTEESKAKAIDELASILREKLKENNLYHVYREEAKLIPILVEMEKRGVEVDVKYLYNYGIEIQDRLVILSEEIFNEAGTSFNIASPKQLSEILFNKMQLPNGRKNKTGLSTDSEVLESLQGFKIAELVLEHRKLSKLYTYVDSLDRLTVNGRVHTTYNQEGTATGRLSSSNPNLQNIPARSLEGLKIRRAFIASKGKKLVVADYSQIELRILAHFSQDEKLMYAYMNDLDLHTLTASRIFHKDQKDISKEEREKAKVVNFSLIYGKSAFGLAKELSISFHEADTYIRRYFEEYSGVKRYIDKVLESARSLGYVETMFGRKRFLENILSRNKMLREASERMAVNAIIQGTQAELIKKAMIELKDKHMILQVHDELVFEEESVSEEYLKEIRDVMEHEYLNVPIKVNIRVVDNWAEAK